MTTPGFPTMTEPAPEIRTHQSVDLCRYIKSGDASYLEAMDAAAKSAPAGLATTMLASSGMNLADDRCYVRSVIDGRPAGSLLHGASLDLHLVLASQGHAMTPYLADQAEAWLNEGRPAARLTRMWAAAEVKKVKEAARAIRAEGTSPRETPSVLLARLEAEKAALLAEMEAVRAQAKDHEALAREAVEAYIQEKARADSLAAELALIPVEVV